MNSTRLLRVVFLLCCVSSGKAQTPNPLRVSTTNPRYFTDNSGKAIFLTGSNSGDELQDDSWSVPHTFNFDNSVPGSISYLDFLAGENHNYIRAFMVEHSRWDPVAAPLVNVLAHPMPYARTGPGFAKDGDPKFAVDRPDGSQFSAAYFNRLLQRAGEAGLPTPSRTTPIYFGVMPFEGFSITNTVPDCNTPPGSVGPLDSWFGHPYNVENNVQRVNGDPHNTGQGLGLLTYGDPDFATINALQDAYVQHFVQTVNGLDNILYEIVNEAPRCPSDQLDTWERHIIKVIRDAEKNTQRQHPVLRGIYGLQATSNQCVNGDNGYLFVNLGDGTDTNAISPAQGDPITEDYGGFASGPKASDGTRVIVSDTDHLWGLDQIPDRPNRNIPGRNNDFSDQPVNWVWKSFTRGMGGLVFLDPDVVPVSDIPPLSCISDCACRGNPIKDDSTSAYAPIRKAMGDARAFAGIIDLIHMTPQACADTGYCLAQTLGTQQGNQFLAFAPSVTPNSLTINLTLIGARAGDVFNLTWFNPQTEKFVDGGSIIAPPNNMTVPVTVPDATWTKAVACLAKSGTSFACPTSSSSLRRRR